MERGRQLQSGIAAERELQLPPRDTRGIRKARKKEAKDIARGRAIREQATEDGAPQDQAVDDESGRHRDRSETKETS
jgi:membrane protein